jgi:hypothetical protein
VARFTDEQVARIRQHLGFGDAALTAALPAGGYATLQVQFLADKAMELLNESGKPRVLAMLAMCESVEQRMAEQMDVAVATRIGDLVVREDGFNELVRQYDHWVAELASALNTTRNPYDERLRARAGGVNGSWSR